VVVRAATRPVATAQVAVITSCPSSFGPPPKKNSPSPPRGRRGGGPGRRSDPSGGSGGDASGGDGSGGGDNSDPSGGSGGDGSGGDGSGGDGSGGVVTFLSTEEIESIISISDAPVGGSVTIEVIDVPVTDDTVTPSVSRAATVTVITPSHATAGEVIVYLHGATPLSFVIPELDPMNIDPKDTSSNNAIWVQVAAKTGIPVVIPQSPGFGPPTGDSPDLDEPYWVAPCLAAAGVKSGDAVMVVAYSAGGITFNQINLQGIWDMMGIIVTHAYLAAPGVNVDPEGAPFGLLASCLAGIKALEAKGIANPTMVQVFQQLIMNMMEMTNPVTGVNFSFMEALFKYLVYLVQSVSIGLDKFDAALTEAVVSINEETSSFRSGSLELAAAIQSMINLVEYSTQTHPMDMSLKWPKILDPEAPFLTIDEVMHIFQYEVSILQDTVYTVAHHPSDNIVSYTTELHDSLIGAGLSSTMISEYNELLTKNYPNSDSHDKGLMMALNQLITDVNTRRAQAELK
jgi:hypothetical protein